MTNSYWGRRALSILAIGAALTFSARVLDANAAGGTYHVLKCHPQHMDADELSQIGDHNSYERVNECGAAFADPKFGIYNDGAAGNTAFEQFMYVAPPHTVIRRVCFEHKLRRQNHHRAEIFAWPGFQILASGGEGPSGWSGTQCWYLNHEQVVVRLGCSEPGGCGDGPNAHAYVRYVDLGLADLADPSITTFSGSLLGGGWIRGSPSLFVDAGDSGSGIGTTVVGVNGADLARRDAACNGGGLPWPLTPTLVPCPSAMAVWGTNPLTTDPPFVNGSNSVTARATDFAGNATSETRTVLVDNASPQIAFANAQDSDDPELIRAHTSDAHSGIAAVEILHRRIGAVTWIPLDARLENGEVQARIDSSAAPPGDYEFTARASDVAGNTNDSTLRQNGTPMRLTFPLRFATRLASRLDGGGSERHTIAYGTPSTVSGRLTDSSGKPLADKELVVVEHFGDGALVRERPTYAITDADGEFQTKVPAGPSRRVVVTFGGTQKFLPARTTAGSLNVRSKASFVTSREELKEGQRLAFTGKVAHHGARIPAGGKLVELQVRVRKESWDTVTEAFRTSDSGRYRIGYRFGRHYVSDAMFRFRLKVQSEGDWPFEGSTSPQRKVTVRAR